MRTCVLAALSLLPAAVYADDAADICKVLDAPVAAWNRGDLDGFMAGYWRSKELTFVSGKDLTRGWDDTLARYRKRYQAEGKKMGQLAFSELDTKILSPDVALVTGKWELKLDPETVGGRYTLVFRKVDGGWKIVHDHTSG